MRIFVPRRVMMVIGCDNGSPYVIHDTTGLTYRDAQGKLTSIDLNGVSVTPLLTGEGQSMIEKNSSAKAAVEIAIYDLFGQLCNAPLYRMPGGGDPVVTTDITISVDYIDKMVADSIAAVDA